MSTKKRLENTTTLFMRKREFGFICPRFTIGMSGDGFLLPRSENHLIKRTLLAPDVPTRNLTGRYTLEVHCNGVQVLKTDVIVAWGNHRAHAEDAFLALKVRDPAKLRRLLRPLMDKNVGLSFRPRLAPHLIRPASFGVRTQPL